MVVAPARARNPQAVLFACGMNSVRSPMAASLLQRMFPHALYVKSAGVRKGALDPFAVAVMAEFGQDISTHKPVTFEELDDWEGLNFDLIITLSPEAHHKALRPMSNIGRPTIPPRPAAIASRSLPPIARSATPCSCAFASGLPRRARRAGKQFCVAPANAGAITTGGCHESEILPLLSLNYSVTEYGSRLSPG
jgi:hypothetical protein